MEREKTTRTPGETGEGRGCRKPPSPYTALHYCLVNQALLPEIQRIADKNGKTLPKQLVLLIEGALAGAGEGYRTNELTDLYLLTRTPGQHNASRQFKLWFRPETLEGMRALAKAARLELREVRTSLILDGLRAEGVELL